MTIVPQAIVDLVALFDANLSDYKKSKFKEAQLRVQFLDPLFEQLGWDVSNKNGYAEAYKDVVHEESLLDEGNRKAPDYSFRIGRERKFFLEAKKPSVNLGNDRAASYQLRRYAWSAGLPLSVVSNFEELVIYDTRIRPERDDSPLTARALHFSFQELTVRWSELAGILSKQAILSGAFDRYAETKLRKGTAPFDKDFLDTLERCRLELAKAIKISNPAIRANDLSFVVQTTIDRVLFLRICEDKGIETFGHLSNLIGKHSYTKLIQVFGDAQKRYNSGLFHLLPETPSDKSYDEVSSAIKISDTAVNSFISALYPPKGPYAFSVVSPEILGSVYERFLGSSIAISGKTVSVELKEEMKKAGGVYYTPAYVVRYMVKGALENILKPSSAELPKFKLLDMACGSGSFLIQIYDELLEWYRQWHIGRGQPSSRHVTRVPNQKGGFEFRLNLEERKRILLEHIFGVDIDPQAVEVTKLSLFLKLIEDSDILPKQLELAPFQRRILPDLSKNIICGNSILGHDVFDLASFTLAQIEVHKPFDWNSKLTFGSIIREGGFDLVIGNPPYSYRKSTVDLFKEYYRRRYKGTQGNYDVYKMFLERGTELLRPGGTICQIVNSSFMIQPQFQKLRQILDDRIILQELDVLGPNVFEDVTLDTAILRGRRRTRGLRLGQILIKEPPAPKSISKFSGYEISQKRFGKSPSNAFEWRLTDEMARLLDRIFDAHPSLDQHYDISVGINTGYIKSEMISERRLSSLYHPCVPGTGIERYGLTRPKGYILYDPAFIKAAGDQGRSLPPQRFFSSNKILVVRTRNTSLKTRIVATIDNERNYNLNRLSNIISKGEADIATLMAILSSEFVNFIFLTRFFNYEIKPVYLAQLPVPSINDPELIKLVKQRIKLSTQRITASAGLFQANQTRIADFERKIDQRVYQLFGLDNAEITSIKNQISALPN